MNTKETQEFENEIVKYLGKISPEKKKDLTQDEFRINLMKKYRP